MRLTSICIVLCISISTNQHCQAEPSTHDSEAPFPENKSDQQPFAKGQKQAFKPVAPIKAESKNTDTSPVSDCQPEVWIPGTPVPADYKVFYDGKESKQLTDGISLEIHGFSCASSTDYVLEFKKNSQRTLLLTHVIYYQIHATKPLLFLENSRKIGAHYLTEFRIINYINKKKKSLPDLACLNGYNTVWHADRLLTYNPEADTNLKGAALCIFNTKGSLTHHFDANLVYAPFGSNAPLHAQNIQVIENRYLLAVSAAADEDQCYLYIKDLVVKDKQFSYKAGQPGELNICQTYQFNFKRLALRKLVGYRTAESEAWQYFALE